MNSNPENIMKAANLINNLRQLLQWDLATTGYTAGNNGVSPTVHMQLQVGGTPVNLWIPSKVLEHAITAEIHNVLTELEHLGIDTSTILEDYKQTGQQILDSLQRKKGVDNPQAS
jgi:hypothetical protein